MIGALERFGMRRIKLFNLIKNFISFNFVIDFLLVNFITIIIFFCVYNKFISDITNVPFYLSGKDDAHFLAVLKNAMQGNSYWEIPDLGAPFKTNVKNFPLLMSFYYLFGRLAGFFTDNVILVNNLYYILTFILSSFFLFYILKKYNVNYFFSILGGLLFSFSQYHFIRSGLQITVSSYFVVALVFYYCLKIARENKFNSKSFDKKENFKLILGLILSSFLIGSTEIYSIYFGLMFLGLSVVISFLNKKYIASLRGGYFILLIVLFLLYNLYPSILANIANETSKTYARSPYEAFFYGLMLVHLFIPYNVKSWHIFSSLSDSYNKAIPFKSEVLYNYLGIFSCIGFVILILILLIEPLKGLINKYESDERKGVLSYVATLNIFALLVGFQSGLSSLISLFGFTQFRAYNRISIYILLFSSFTFVYVLDLLLKNLIKQKKFLFLCSSVFSLSMIVVHFVDINPQNIVQDFNTNKNNINNVKEYAKNLESYYKNNVQILQLPILSFVENRVTDIFTNCNYQALPYLFTNKIKYSFGAFNKTKEFFIQNVLFNDTNIKNVVINAKRYGFDGISVNTDIYGNSDIVDSLTNLLGEPKIISKQKNIFLFDLKNFESSEDISYQNINLIEKDSYVINGFSELEKNENSVFRWAVCDKSNNNSNNMNLNVINSSLYYFPINNKPYKIYIKVHTPIDNTLKVFVNNQVVGEFEINKGDSEFETNVIYENFNDILSEPNVIRLEHSKSFTPSDFDKNSTDKRVLTVAYKEISVKILE